MITEQQMHANLFSAKAFKMVDKHFKTHNKLKFGLFTRISQCLSAAL